MSDYKDTSTRHLKHKLQSLSRRLDELEEATNKLQKSEDELLDLQDKIIQAEGSNSALLSDVEALRKRLLKIEGKDEEVCKAEDLCRTVREKLEEEESLTQELKTEIERLQRRMAELEKLEEAFGKCKSDCSQLCLGLNEEKNLTKKLASELEALKARLKEADGSETRLDKAEQALAGELEKLKAFTQAFVSERKRLLEKQREDEKVILKLTEKLERQKNSLDSAANLDRADVMRSRIEDKLSSSGKLGGRKRSLDYLKHGEDNVGLRNEKNSSLEGPEEDNKVKELTQEVERLKSRLKQLEVVEEDLKDSESKNRELREKFQLERDRSQQLSEQVDQLRTQINGRPGKGGHHGAPGSPAKGLENGKAENEEINVRGGFRQDKPKYRSAASSASEPTSPKHRSRELSPQHKRDAKLRSKELSHSEESSPRATRRALSPAQSTRRTPKTTAAAADNGLRETGRGLEDKTRGAANSAIRSAPSDSKKMSVLSRYPPAANDQKPWRSAPKQSEEENKRSKVEKFSRLYSDSEFNHSDVVAENASRTNSSLPPEKKAVPASDAVTLDQETFPVSALSKANGSVVAYTSHASPLLPSDHGSEGHSSASETESTGSRPSEPEPVTEVPATVSSRTTAPKYPRHSRLNDSHSEGSSSRSSLDEELQSRPLLADGGALEATHYPSGGDIHHVCSPRESRMSKAIIKPAIVESDRKEVMSEQAAANGKPKISTKPVLTTTSKMTSSITIYPKEPSSSRTSSRSSSISSEPAGVRERHTSTSNILIGSVLSPSSEQRGSISIPYEISIPKSEITLRPSQELDQTRAEDQEEPLGATLLETTSSSHLRSQRSSFSLETAAASSADATNDTESGFESSSSGSTTTVTSWRSHRHDYGQHSQDDSLPELRNVTVRSTWRNRGAASVDEPGGRGAEAARLPVEGGGSEEELEAATTWRAYRATTVLDTEEAGNSRAGTAGNSMTQKAAKPSPAEVYMRRINSVVTSTREVPEPLGRRIRGSQSPPMEAGGLGRPVAHEPVSSQAWGRGHTSMAPDSTEPRPNPPLWRRNVAGGDPHLMGAAARGEQGSAGRAEGRSGAGTMPWSKRPSEQN
ncbi:LOW QUALITY PROTEIN: leucine zipper protein 1 [Aplochiton taeniatus]